MDKDKLNKAAEEARITTAISARSDWHHSLDGVNLDVSIDELVESFFVGGADWLMQQPISERLTEEEKENIMELYKSEVNSMELENSRINKTKNPIDKLSHEANWWMAKSKAGMLERIFGIDLFKENLL